MGSLRRRIKRSHETQPHRPGISMRFELKKRDKVTHVLAVPVRLLSHSSLSCLQSRKSVKLSALFEIFFPEEQVLVTSGWHQNLAFSFSHHENSSGDSNSFGWLGV